jgi:predicted DNA-binding transcriptional regulator AlpA
MRKEFLPDPRLWTPEQVAMRLNRSVPWLYEHMPRLRQLGFPDKDAELGGWDSKAIETWIDRRSRIDTGSNVEQQMLEAIRG